MFKTLWFLFIAAAIAASIAWMLDNNGSIIIYWLGYEVKTDILTAILLMVFFALVIFVAAYAIAKFKSIRFSKLPQLFKKKNAK